jgi:hypothetical protein
MTFNVTPIHEYIATITHNNPQRAVILVLRDGKLIDANTGGEEDIDAAYEQVRDCAKRLRELKGLLKTHSIRRIGPGLSFVASVRGQSLPETAAPSVQEVRDKIKAIGLNPNVFSERD